MMNAFPHEARRSALPDLALVCRFRLTSVIEVAASIPVLEWFMADELESFWNIP